MPAFDYVALDGSGKREKGVISADSARSARKELRLRQLTPIRIDEAKEKSKRSTSSFSRSKLTESDRILVTRQLAMLIGAGTPVEEAVNSVASQMDRVDGRKVMMSIRGSITEGYRFSEALSEHPREFTPLFRAIVGAGETSGNLGTVLERLAEYQEKAKKVRQKIIAALIYPIMLSMVAVGVIVSLLIFVVPRVVSQFDTFDQELPALTQTMLAISSFLSQWGLVLLVAAPVAILLSLQSMRSESVKYAMDRLLLRVPVVGNMISQTNAARFARTLSTLLESGAPMLDSLEAARGSLSNAVFNQAVGTIANSVKEGAALSRSMKATSVFPSLLVHLTNSGETSGQVPLMLAKGAEFLEDEFDTSSEIALNLMEPLIIVVLGGIVALVILSIMLPILQLNTLALG